MGFFPIMPGLEEEIGFFWTGSRVVSETITKKELVEVGQVLRRKPVIWDNLHANDYDQQRMYLGEKMMIVVNVVVVPCFLMISSRSLFRPRYGHFASHPWRSDEPELRVLVECASPLHHCRLVRLLQQEDGGMQRLGSRRRLLELHPLLLGGSSQVTKD